MRSQRLNAKRAAQAVDDSEQPVAAKKVRHNKASATKKEVEKNDVQDNTTPTIAIEKNTKLKTARNEKKNVTLLPKNEPSTSGIGGRRSQRNKDPVFYTTDVDVKEESKSDDELPIKSKNKKPSKGTKQAVENGHADGPKIKKSKTGKSSAKDKSGSKKENAPSKSAVERKLVKKGRAAVDSLCPVAATSHVLDEGDDIWDCMLNQTNIQFNNNKYYIIQLLEDDKGGVYSVWMRWGRVGANGQNSLKPCGGNIELAKNIFSTKFRDKTRNEWSCRDCFEKVPGKYDLLHMDYSDEPLKEESSDQADGPSKERKPIKSELDDAVRELVELVCDIKIMEAAVLEMKYDAVKAPLGKLTKEQIKSGYLALLDISNIVNVGSGKVDNRALLTACNDFYTRIPHYFGMKVPPLIRSPSEVREKLQLLEALGDIEAAMTFLKDSSLDDSVHPADRNYKGMQCDIKPLAHDSEDYDVISKYVSLNHGKTHSSYKLKVEQIFVCEKKTEQERFMAELGNRMLLWHGSRLSNWAGILNQGLRIAPPEAPVTGYMFGKGIYFADMSSKSANYCMASCTNTTGILTLCEVALGVSRDLKQADYNADKLPKGYQSVKGVGRMTPQEANQVKMEDGVIVPLGPASSKTQDGLSLLYNEYIVYNPAQVRLRYLVKDMSDGPRGHDVVVCPADDRVTSPLESRLKLLFHHVAMRQSRMTNTEAAERYLHPTVATPWSPHGH
ncbi:Poly(ADP-ribose) polymerase regulatory domain [Trinorchestia longiramus]|nr:Poly(ADP-ribose) polymerase regulatory domain [Trinorchestia longiramus]